MGGWLLRAQRPPAIFLRDVPARIERERAPRRQSAQCWLVFLLSLFFLRILGSFPSVFAIVWKKNLTKGSLLLNLKLYVCLSFSLSFIFCVTELGQWPVSHTGGNDAYSKGLNQVFFSYGSIFWSWPKHVYSSPLVKKTIISNVGQVISIRSLATIGGAMYSM